MSSLVSHIALLCAYKNICGKAVENETVEKGSPELFFAKKFHSEAAGTFWRHLEEIARLLPDQAELAAATKQANKDMSQALAGIITVNKIFEKAAT